MKATGQLDVFFYEAFAEEEESLRRHLPANVHAGFTSKTIQESDDAKPPVPLVSIRTQSIVPAQWAGSLAGILTRATGYDGLKRFLLTTGAQVACGYLPLYCARAVAEQAALFWLALLRKLPLQTKQFATFHRDGLTGFECERKRLLVVGVGNIGSEIARIGKGLGMDVRGVDISQPHAFVSYVTKEEGLPWADVIVCAMNLTADNVGYFNYASFVQTKQGVIFVNVARGEMSPPVDLLQLMEEGHLGGVALDVFDGESALAVALRTGKGGEGESVKATLELAKRPNVICTPHNAFNTVESVERKSEQSVQQIEHFLKDGKFLWPVPGAS
jgi:D-lactate dehydrogenase